MPTESVAQNYQIRLKALPTLTFHYRAQHFHSLTLDLLNSPLTDESIVGLFFTELWNRRALFLLGSVISKRRIPDSTLRQALRELVESAGSWRKARRFTRWGPSSTGRSDSLSPDHSRAD